jgi:hypothetical protein
MTLAPGVSFSIVKEAVSRPPAGVVSGSAGVFSARGASDACHADYACHAYYACLAGYACYAENGADRIPYTQPFREVLP